VNFLLPWLSWFFVVLFSAEFFILNVWYAKLKHFLIAVLVGRVAVIESEAISLCFNRDVGIYVANRFLKGKCLWLGLI